MCENSVKIGEVVISNVSEGRLAYLCGLGGEKFCSCAKKSKRKVEEVVIEDVVVEEEGSQDNDVL